ncbi:aminodeoxychorismate/anthranilate synthase component II [Calderihabitans maritimus]|uniref:Anthranilate synthase subunit II n=1 Tax=Calderihabitans maritimus TaxID=1246530 RepID=A0A1Z5HP52_9FIRM|nr:aminodeoxychorismate/anthranilate synthase component II [Calderihabitans maritimus]GAW91309.1 anthranilate synthase subunit II [Calderihabitans maritimus]
MILLIDNYDSFIYNLFQYLGELGEETEVYRNDSITLEDIETMKPDHIIISPGPCTPNEAGISVEVVKKFAGRIPILGVCLGHQCIGQAFGAEVVRAERLMHGKTSLVFHDNKTIFTGLKNPLQATRYHSLILRKETLPSCLEVSAVTAQGEIMAVRHRELPVEGVQFHPEAILTEQGHDLLKNFLSLKVEGVNSYGLHSAS